MVDDVEGAAAGGLLHGQRRRRPLRGGRRGRALAAFFGITGALTAVGPLAGGYLTEWTWRAIFWINIPVAIIALILTFRPSRPRRAQPGPIDYRAAVLISAGMGFVVLGPAAGRCLGLDGRRRPSARSSSASSCSSCSSPPSCAEREPLIRVRLFEDRGFFVDNAVLLLMSAVFVPFFFFASVYAQAALGFSATNAGLFLLVFFGGFATAAQWGGRIVDKRGARPAVDPRLRRLGGRLLPVGPAAPDLDFGSQWYWIVVAGAGLGLVLGPVSTDALNRAPGAGYGEVTGITQTVRNLGASLGLAVMGSLFASGNVDQVGSTLRSNGVPAAEADRIAHSITAGGNTGSGGLASQAGSGADAILHAVKVDIAQSTQTVVWIMAGIMAAAFIVARLLPKAAPVPVAEDTVRRSAAGSARGQPSRPRIRGVDSVIRALTRRVRYKRHMGLARHSVRSRRLRDARGPAPGARARPAACARRRSAPRWMRSTASSTLPSRRPPWTASCSSPLVERAVTGLLAGPLVDAVADAVIRDAVIERVSTEIVRAGVAERVVEGLVADGVVERSVTARRSTTRASSSLVLTTLDSDRVEALVGDRRRQPRDGAHGRPRARQPPPRRRRSRRLLASDELWDMIDQIASSKAVGDAIAHQSMGLADEMADEVRIRSRRMDDWLERATRRAMRRRRRSAAGPAGRDVAGLSR